LLKLAILAVLAREAHDTVVALPDGLRDNAPRSRGSGFAQCIRNFPQGIGKCIENRYDRLPIAAENLHPQLRGGACNACRVADPLPCKTQRVFVCSCEASG